jgi:hypothetical protein
MKDVDYESYCFSAEEHDSHSAWRYGHAIEIVVGKVFSQS